MYQDIIVLILIVLFIVAVIYEGIKYAKVSTKAYEDMHKLMFPEIYIGTKD